MSEIQLLRYQLIDAIMSISDVKRLRSLYQNAQPSKPLPDPNIPVMEVKSGVTLEEIRAGQTVKEINYKDFRQRIEAEEWKESLEELLNTLD